MRRDMTLNNAVPSGGRSPEQGTANKRHHLSAKEEVRAGYYRECMEAA